MRPNHLLDHIRDRDRLYLHRGRSLRNARLDGPFVTIGRKRLINACSNDYLGMPATGMPGGQMSSSSRLLAGTEPVHGRLEAALARHRSCEAALVFPTGYMANLGVLQAVADADTAVYSDSLNHASIIDACRLAKTRTTIYPHNDMDALQGLIGRDRSRKKLIITEGVFSMDGDSAPLKEISEIGSRYGAVTMVDDAHGDFVLGGGMGTAHEQRAQIDIHVSSMSKALGSFGGYVAADRSVINLCVNLSRSFIYTSALPAPLAGHALLRLRTPMGSYRRRLWRNVDRLYGLLADANRTPSKSHIMPILFDGAAEADQARAAAYGRGVFTRVIRPPTVARGARIRLSVTGWFDDRMVDQIAAPFNTVRN